MNHDEAFTRGYNKSNEELQEMEWVLVGRYVSFYLMILILILFIIMLTS